MAPVDSAKNVKRKIRKIGKSKSTDGDMKWADGDIDKLYQERSENLAFEYKNEYWQELNAMMPYAVSGGSDVDMDDNEIDKLFQSKANDLSFSYKSSYWKEMAAMLPERKKRDALWYFTSFVFMGLLVMTPFVGQDEIESNNFIAQKDNAPLFQGEINNSTNAVVEERSQEVLKNASVSNDANPNFENENYTTSNQDQNSGNNPNSEFVAPIENLQDVDATNNTDVNGNNRAGTDLNNSEGDDMNNNADANNIAGVDANNNANTNVAKSDENNNLLGDNSVDVENKNYEASATTPEIIISNEMVVEDETSETSATTLEIISSNEVAETPSNVEIRINEIGDLAVKPLGRSEISNDIIDLNQSIAALRMPTITNLYVELNGGVSQSLISPSEKISYALGVGIGTQIQKGKFIFVTGLNALMSFHEDIELSRQAKVYGFGSETYSYKLNYKQLYSVEAVLSVGYKMGLHTLSVGVRPSFVLSSKVAYDSGAPEGTERQVLYGHMDGIKRFGIKPMIGYAVNLSPNLLLGANVGMKLTPSVNEDFINGVNNRLPIDGQIFLRKTLSFRR